MSTPGFLAEWSIDTGGSKMSLGACSASASPASRGDVVPAVYTVCIMETVCDAVGIDGYTCVSSHNQWRCIQAYPPSPPRGTRVPSYDPWLP